MTCIVGIKNKSKGNVLIAGDSAAVSGIDIQIEKQPKVFKNGDFIFGCTSSFRMIQLLKFNFKPPLIDQNSTGFKAGLKSEEIDVYEYMCTKFVNELRDCFRMGGILNTHDGIENGGVFLVGYQDQLFRVNSDFFVMETIDGFDSVGCGQSYALGVLKQLESSKIDVKDKLESALNIAAYFSGGVVAPYHFVESDSVFNS